MDQSRRRFFKTILLRKKNEKQTADGEVLLILGSLAAFPVNTIKKMKFAKANLVIESLPEGLRVREESGGKNYKVSVGFDGLLRAHMNEEWPESAIFSLSTGEIYNI